MMVYEYFPSGDPSFAHRRQAVIDTADEHGLRSADILVRSGAAFALYGLDARVDEFATGPFDVDAIFDTTSDEIGDKYFELLTHVMHGTRPPHNGSSPILPIGPLELPKKRWAEALQVEYAFPITRVEGILVPSLATLVHSKARAGRTKDSVGLLKSYLLAQQTGSSHASDPAWREALPQAINSIEQRKRQVTQKNLPWLSNLVEIRFQVPELADIIAPLPYDEETALTSFQPYKSL